MVPFILYALLSIPSIDLYSKPVYNCSWNNPAMQRCMKSNRVARYVGTQMLAGHNYDDFGRLYDVDVGDRIRYNRKIYSIYAKEIVKDTDTWTLNMPPNELRMHTSTNNPRTRLMVFARLTKR